MSERSSRKRQMRRKASSDIRSWESAETYEPEIFHRAAKVQGDWATADGGVTWPQILSLPRYSKSALSWNIQGDQPVAVRLKKSHASENVRKLLNVDFVRQAGLPFTLSHRIVLHGIFSELCYTQENQTTFGTVLLRPIRVGSAGVERQLVEAYKSFFRTLEHVISSLDAAKVHLQGYTEVALHSVDSGGEGSFVRSYCEAEGIDVDNNDIWAVPHVHVLLTGFDKKGVFPTTYWSRLLSPWFSLSNQTRFENIGLRKKLGGNVSENARRVICYAKKERERSDLEIAFEYYVQRYLPNNGWFELTIENGNEFYNHAAQVFFSKRDFILNHRMPEGFRGFDDKIESLLNWSDENDCLFTDEVHTLVRNSETLEAGFHVYMDREILQERVLNWGDLTCKICLDDECSCLSESLELFRRIQINGYADPWYDGTIFERQRSTGNFMSTAQKEAFASKNGTFNPKL